MGFYSSIIDTGTKPPDSELVYSVVTGIVRENWDKEHPGMVKVEYFLGEKGKNVTGWVPVAVPYAGAGYGFYALPEVSDTVVIAFDRGDRNCPIVIGSLWNKVNTLPPETAAEKNNIKRFRTKDGCEIMADGTENKSKLEISTPKKLRIVLEDETEKITVSDDKGKNSILLDCQNGVVTISGEKKLELKANGKTMLSLDGNAGAIKLDGNKLDINGSQALNVKGGNTQITGTMLTAKGDSSAKVESSGVLQMKGAMVKIN